MQSRRYPAKLLVVHRPLPIFRAGPGKAYVIVVAVVYIVLGSVESRRFVDMILNSSVSRLCSPYTAVNRLISRTISLCNTRKVSMYYRIITAAGLHVSAMQ